MAPEKDHSGHPPQIDRNDNAYLTLKDGNGSVIAITGFTGGPVEQYTYGPYGELLAADSYTTHVANRVGHQGLFFERFDGQYNWPHLVPGAKGIYHNRNRTYSPALGRFLQRDPNATGAALLDSYASRGQPIAPGISSLDLQSLYTDGMSLYQYQRSNPVNGSDALGLRDDFEDLIDGSIGDLIGGRVATMMEINDSIKKTTNAALMIGQMAISMMPGGDAVILMGKLAKGGDFSFSDLFGAVASFVPGSAAAKGIFLAGAAFGKVRGAYKVAKAGRNLTAQKHHAISKRVHDALEKHKNLQGKYEYQDDRFLTQAIDYEAHHGYETWHRDLDKEVAKWIGDPKNKYATQAEFEAYLRSRYLEGDLVTRFPNALE